MNVFKLILLILSYFITQNMYSSPNMDRYYETFFLPFKDGAEFYISDKFIENEVRSSWIEKDTIKKVELLSSLYICRPESPLSKAINLYLEEFELFKKNTSQSGEWQMTEPLATVIAVDENIDGSYFYFMNLNNFVDNRIYLRDCIGVVERDGHSFFITKSLLGNVDQTDDKVSLFLNIRHISIKPQYRSRMLYNSRTGLNGKMTQPERPESGDIIRRFTMFIPWREVNK